MAREGKCEKFARENGITEFITVDDIINLPMDEFNDRLDLHQSQGMTEKQRRIARDIRRRERNKIAAQNCRKRANTRLDDLKQTVEREKKERIELEQYINSLKAESKIQQELKDKWDSFILIYGYEHGHERGYHSYDIAQISVEDMPERGEEDPYPFKIHLKSPSPEMSRCVPLPLRPKAVWPDHYPPPTYPVVTRVTRDPRGAVLFPMPPGGEFIRYDELIRYGPYGPPHHPVSLYQISLPTPHHPDTKIKHEEVEDLSQG